VPEGKRTNTGDPMQQVAWDVVRDETSLQVAVITEEIGQVLSRWVRDELAIQLIEIKRNIGKVLGLSRGDEMDTLAPFVDDQRVRMKADSSAELLASLEPDGD
jgi:hypothetical protein